MTLSNLNKEKKYQFISGTLREILCLQWESKQGLRHSSNLYHVIIAEICKLSSSLKIKFPEFLKIFLQQHKDLSFHHYIWNSSPYLNLSFFFKKKKLVMVVFESESLCLAQDQGISFKFSCLSIQTLASHISLNVSALFVNFTYWNYIFLYNIFWFGFTFSLLLVIPPISLLIWIRLLSVSHEKRKRLIRDNNNNRKKIEKHRVRQIKQRKGKECKESEKEKIHMQCIIRNPIKTGICAIYDKDRCTCMF